jgi:predicted TIM-barrel fold metal-dependent hydrolase
VHRNRECSQARIRIVSEPDFPIVDAHQHFWDLKRNYYPWLCDPVPIPFRYGDYRSLRKDYLPDDYRRDTTGYHIAMTVHVEAEWDTRDPVAETRWLEMLQREHGLPTACVAQAWLDRADVEAILAAQASHPIVRGVRHKPRAAPTAREAKRGIAGSMDDPRWRDGFALLERFSLCFDLQTPWWHLDAACEIARDFPNTPIIINHTGLPADRSVEGLAAWRSAMQQSAQQDNVFVKISGLGQPGKPWSVDENAPIVRDTIAIFGVERCMFASNYPVDKLCATFDSIYAGFRASVYERSVAEQRMLFQDNAIRIYRLGERQTEEL